MIRVIAIITAKPGQRDAVLAAFNANRPTVLEEQGCREYVATVDHPDAAPGMAQYGPDTIAIIETWDSLEHLAAHAASPHMKDYGRRTRDLLASRAVYVLAPT